MLVHEIIAMKGAPALFLCFAALFLFNALCLFSGIVNPSYGWTFNKDMVVGLVLGAFLSAVQAIVVFPLAWFFLRRKEMRQSAKYWLTVAAILAAPGIVLWPTMMTALMLPGPLVLFFAALITSSRLPNVYLTPGLCFKCGYDLTGNVSGVCPECGRPTQPQSTIDNRPSTIRA